MNNGVSTIIFGSNELKFTPFLSHPISQNNGGATLHITLKFPTKCMATLHHCNKPIEGGYTIKTLNGVPYFC